MECNATLDTRVICKEGTAYIFAEGKMNSNTSEEFKKLLDNTTEKNIVLDFSKLQYISSAGLRVLVSTMRRLEELGGTMTIESPTAEVTEVFEMTGLSGMLVIR